jgi:hypothetical protein
MRTGTLPGLRIEIGGRTSMATVNFVTGMDCALGIESLGGQLRNEAVVRTDPVVSSLTFPARIKFWPSP